MMEDQHNNFLPMLNYKVYKAEQKTIVVYRSWNECLDKLDLIYIICPVFVRHTCVSLFKVIVTIFIVILFLITLNIIFEKLSPNEKHVN